MEFSNLQKKEACLKQQFQEHTYTVFQQYSPEFYKNIVEYGTSFAEEIFNHNRYELFDPMVSDRSCQLRAIWFACFKKMKPRFCDLDEDDFLLFGLAKFLCKSAISVESDITGPVPLKTRSAYWPENVIKLPNAAIRRHFLGEAKALLAQRILVDMHYWLQAIPPEKNLIGMFPANIHKAYDELLQLFQHLPYSSYSEVDIPVIHFLPGFIAVATLAAQFNVILSVIFRKIVRSPKGILQCVDQHVTHFSFNSSTNTFEEKTILSDAASIPTDPVVVFSGHSHVDPDIGSKINPRFIVSSLNELFGCNVSILDYIYAIMSTHAALPGERKEGDWKIEEAPELTQITEKYLNFAKSVDLSVYSTVTQIYNEMQSGSLCNLMIAKTPFEITHVYNNSIKNLL